MSAKYQAFFVARNALTEPHKPFPTENILEALENSENHVTTYSGTSNFYPELLEMAKGVSAKGSSRLIVKLRSHHTCRETLLSALNVVSTAYTKGIHPLSSAYYYILYEQLNGIPLDKEFRNLVVQVFEKISANHLFTCYNSPRGIIITCGNMSSLRNQWTLSFLLYIFRSASIMNNILKKFPDGTDFSTFLLYMSEQFLLNPAWGDDFNNNILMSMFCFLSDQSEGFMDATSFRNGPCNAVVYGCRPNNIYKYIRHVYVPSMGISAPKFGHYVSEFFPETFNLFLELYKYKFPESTKPRRVVSPPENIQIKFKGVE